MSHTKARVLQYIVILLILAIGGGGYWYWQNAQAAVARKAADNLGLVGYWSFDEGTGTQAGDASGNGNTGTLTNSPTWVDGKLGQALNFNGTDNYVNIGDVELSNAAITISVWFKPDITSVSNDIVGKYSDQELRSYVLFAAPNSTYHFIVSDNGSSGAGNLVTAVGTSNQQSGIWAHVVGTFDGVGTVKIYVNGVLENTTTDAGVVGIFNSTRALRIGNISSNGERYVNGSIDETRIYNRALGATEITNLYNLGAAKVGASQNSALTTGLVGLWSFDGADVSSTLAYDKSGNGNNGTFSGGPEKVNGRIGQALNFWPGGADTNARVNVGDPAVLNFGTGDFSVGLWFKTTGWVGQGGISSSNMFLSKRSNDSPNTLGYFLHIAQITNKVGFYVNDGTSSSGVSSPNAVNDNNWHYVMGVRSGGNMTLYLDGVSVSTGAAPTGSVSSTTTFNIGQDDNTDRTINGSIDEVRAYNRTLTTSEVWDLYQLGAADKVNSADSQADSLKKGLAGYWKLDDASGSFATDSSGNANTGTLAGAGGLPTWTTGQIGGGLSFDGVDDNVAVSYGSVLSSSTNISYSFWAKPDLNEVMGILGALNGEDGTVYNYLTLDNSGTEAGNPILRITRNIGGSTASRSVQFSYSVNQWFHFTYTYDGAYERMFINGSKLGEWSQTGNFASNTEAGLRLGNTCASGACSAYFKGILDEVRVYNRVLSAEEITKLYKTTAPDNPDTGLVGYWSFNGSDISGATTVYDRSGKSNTGTLTGGPAPINGQVGQSIDFDGSDDSLSVADAASLDFGSLSDLAITGWFSRDTFTTDDTIFAKRNGIVASDTGYIAYIDDATDKFTFEVSDGTDEYQLESASAFAGTGWHHFAVVMPASPEPSPALYIDGAYETTVATGNIGNIGDLSNALTLRIGSESDNGNPFDGKLDEIRVYNRVLTAAEVWGQYTVAETGLKTCGTVTDADSNIYGTVVIGSQCWMRQNMRIGTRIAGATTQANNGTTEKYCYSDSDANCTSLNPNQPDGGLYRWDEAMQYSTTAGARGICPAGWHIPTDAEQHTLENYLKDAGQTCDASRSGYDCSSAGTKLKPGGTSGFEANLAGHHAGFGTFYDRGVYGNYWLSSESGSPNAWRRYLSSSLATINRNATDKGYGLSVRCLKN